MMTAFRPTHRSVLVALVTVWSAATALAQEPAVPAPARPRIGLVLSGGGARGFAHIGVLRALRELNVPIDVVVGTSMGCVVGGAYAAGQSIEELEKIVRTTDWDQVVADRPARNELTFRRRDEDLELPSRLEFGVSRHGLTLPPATAGNGALELALTRLLPADMHDRPANGLPLPFRSVAADLLTGEMVILSDTSLFLTMRASLSVPGVFAPVRVNQRLLVDGGLVRNLPVDLARALGADIVIAVNVGTPLAGEGELGSSLAVAQQMLHILTAQNVERSLSELRPEDILIKPDLSTVSFMDFHAYERAMRAGGDATRRVAGRLQSLAIPAEHYAAQERLRQGGREEGAPALPLAQVEVQGATRINPAALVALSGLRPGEPVTPAEVRRAAGRLYSRADVGSVAAEIADADGRRRVILHVTEPDWARSRLRLGLELATDFSDNSTFGVVAMHVIPSLGPWGAELRTVGRIGSRRSILSELWQPLGVGSDFYLAPSLGYGAGPTDVIEAGRRQQRLGVEGIQAGAAFGWQLADWGDLRLGVTRSRQQTRLLIPADPSQRPETFSASSRYLQLRVDTLEPIAFPVRGHLLQALWTQPFSQSQPGPTPWRSQVVALGAFGSGAWGGHFYGEWTRSLGGFSPLGGFLRLSGTDPQSVDGHTNVFGRLVLARRIGYMPPPFGSAIRAGFSLELGNGFAAGQSLRLADLRQAASAFLAVDTRFGPLYFGAGATRGDTGTLYLFLGPIW